jgi:hypothetical protein
MRLIDFKIKLKEEFENFESYLKEMNSKKLSQMPKSTVITVINISVNIIMDDFIHEHPLYISSNG